MYTAKITIISTTAEVHDELVWTVVVESSLLSLIFFFLRATTFFMCYFPKLTKSTWVTLTK